MTNLQRRKDSTEKSAGTAIKAVGNPFDRPYTSPPFRDAFLATRDGISYRD